MSIRKKRILLGAVLLLPLFLVALFFLPSVRAHAAEPLYTGAYDFKVMRYHVRMEVSPNRDVRVEERFTVKLTGYQAHGVIRDLPLENGLRYSALEMSCEDSDDFEPYVRSTDAEDGSEFLSVYLRGSEIATGQTRSYRLAYTMSLPSVKEEGYLSLDILGFGITASVEEFSAEVTVPDGLEEYRIYAPSAVQGAREGNVITLSGSALSALEGVTLDMRFREGVLGSSFDMTIVYALLLCAGVVLAAIVVKLLFCRQPVMTSTVNYSAPEEMDPLLMGKLIDGAVDKEDLGALVFYLADQGYLEIDLSDEKDPLLIKTEKELPADAPEHLSVFYRGLFAGREKVRVSELAFTFYRTAQTATNAANAAAGKLHSARGKTFMAIFAVLSALVLGGFPFLYGLLVLFGGYFYWLSAALCLAGFCISLAGSYYARQREEKWRKYRQVLLSAGTFLLALLPCVFYLFIPNAAMSVWSGLILVAGAALTGTVSGRFLTRTEEHTKRLGQILGFKEFILYTEKDKLEMMLQEEPELYYHILPYAQVLGVTSEWTDKFKSLSLEPPAYARGYRVNAFDVIVWHSMFRTMNTGMSRSMFSRPSSSGGGGHHAGGFGGGFGGGGFGGGGMRGC